eukprot:CAMPEP_0195055596 /NCGR_PEP_ID=MMETSP0448-20130528/4237_1 /TAXON_ID=66468 /ORGANISM="Heterocapsa triquestra, Strain CCMP 448" /LENGTH=94 /DNA_ID=CAMNT_0040085275 /DNA_START=21 /DNA_END=303 /DNA_ORIENTATION=+
MTELGARKGRMGRPKAKGRDQPLIIANVDLISAAFSRCPLPRLPVGLTQSEALVDLPCVACAQSIARAWGMPLRQESYKLFGATHCSSSQSKLR